MARTKIKDPFIESELVYSLAKSAQGSLVEMEEFISSTNTADLQMIGDRLYDEKIYKAAKILYNNIGNNSKLASTHVQLEEYQQAVDAAKKANNPKTWKEICISCIS